MSGYEAYQEVEIAMADPVQLIELLYQGALDSVRSARIDLAAGQIERRGRAISKASAIVMELSASLDLERGGEIARNLAALYQYILMRLSESHVKASDTSLAEVERLMASLAPAWSSCRQASEVRNPLSGIEERLESLTF
jgi:flagellar secretion chaperone FliS